MDAIRQQLKIFSRQYNLYMKSSAALVSNLISLSDKVFPAVNELFTSPERADGHQKWIDFFTTFWHCECISRVSVNAFIERYQKWCKRKEYRFSASKASDIYIESLGHIVTLPKNNNTKLLIQTAAKELTAMNEQIAVVRNEMIRLAKELPEYETVHAMFGVGEITAAQLMAEIGDIRNYPRRSSLVGFAGVDPEVNQSGKHEWEARIDHRTDGQGCPYCEGKKVIPKETSFAVKHPKMAKQWHPTQNSGRQPYEFTEFSHFEAIWICPKGHEYPMPIYRRSRGCGCSVCAGKRVLAGYNDIESQAPHLALEWDDELNEDIKPSEVALHSNNRYHWKCTVCGHQWKTSPNNRAKGTGCPACKHCCVDPLVNSLAVVNPKLAKQ